MAKPTFLMPVSQSMLANVKLLMQLRPQATTTDIAAQFGISETSARTYRRELRRLSPSTSRPAKS